MTPGFPREKRVRAFPFYFICEDAIAIYKELKSRGIQASEPQVGNGMWVNGLSDPDGYRLLFESATATPEETQFSELKH
jgi:hypothetical protein